VVASVFLSLYLPCMASCMVTVRELGVKDAARVIAMNLAAALVFASGLNLLIKFL
jgi:Fe2+ transport system protein B